MFDSKSKNDNVDHSNAHAYLPDFMFGNGVNDFERWEVELMYLVWNEIKEDMSDEAKERLTKEFMDSNANTFVMNESSIAMDTFLTNLDDYDIKVPISLLEPLLAVAKYTVDYGTTKEQFDAMCKRLLANAKTSH